MTDNKALWKRAFMTDPRAVKPITGKAYKGNSPKPYWIVERLTEEFGPCGIGWGFTILSERMERLTETDVLHVAVVRMWYELDGKRGEFEQIGQTKATYWSAGKGQNDGSKGQNDGKMVVDEDAPKKSVTDALVKCASYLGFAGDIFSGMWDDSKYVENAAAEYISKEKAEARAAWLEEQALKLESCASMAELGEVWKAIGRTAKAENDPDAIQTLEPIKDRMKATLQPEGAKA